MVRRISASWTPPKRQTEIRLSKAQQADLAWELRPYPLTPDLLATVEDQLFLYREKRALTQRTDGILEYLERIEREASQLLSMLESAGIDPEFREVLRGRIRFWKSAPRPRHRVADDDMSWCALAVVRALDGAGVPLVSTKRRNEKSFVVPVLQLFREWASGLAGRKRSGKRTGADYDFANAIIEAYRSNPITRATVEALYGAPNSRS
jgi:hypothetical protein